jgi:hypothetical protein
MISLEISLENAAVCRPPLQGIAPSLYGVLLSGIVPMERRALLRAPFRNSAWRPVKGAYSQTTDDEVIALLRDAAKPAV